MLPSRTCEPAAPALLPQLEETGPAEANVVAIHRQRICPACGESFKPRRPEAIYCAGACRAAAHRARHRLDVEARLDRAEAGLAAVAHKGSDLMYLDEIMIDPAWTGANVELAVVRRLADTLGAGCELAVMSYQRPEEALHWGRMGFTVTRPPPEGGWGYMHLALAFRHPRIADPDYEERFRVIPNPSSSDRRTHH